MLQLLKIEWLKVKNYRTFWILSTLYIVGIFGAIYIAKQVMESVPQKPGADMAKTLLGKPLEFPEVWQSVSYISSFGMFMLGLLIIISITNEFSYKTHRQNIIDGLSRGQFIRVKMMLAVIVAAVATITVFLTALIFGLAEGSAFDTENIEYIGYFFLQALSYCSVALLFSLLFKRSGITIGVYFLYITILENLLAGILNKYTDNIGRYLPLETTDNLIRNPFLKVIMSMLTTSYNTEMLLVMSVVYLALYYVIAYRKWSTDDL